MIHRIRETYPDTTITLRYGKSFSTHGLQISDVISNTVFKAMVDREGAALEEELIRGLAGTLIEECRRRCQLAVSNAKLNTIRPNWLIKEQV